MRHKKSFFVVILIFFLVEFAYGAMDSEMKMDHGQEMPMNQEMKEDMSMHGILGNYAMTREASGTSWQPDSSPIEGLHFMKDDWMFMLHGFANVVYDQQNGKRGNKDVFSSNMLMGMAQHPLGPGTWGVRSMISLEPLTIGKEGYPLLLQSGETANGQDPLIDKQHPHDLFMELATTYSVPLTSESSAFVYFGLPGEPALGPPAFMHRFSGAINPEAPITHHWLDSTHITYGVVTAGYIWNQFKIEASNFTGREPDQERWNFDQPKFDSFSSRLSFNPTSDWSFQTSYGYLHSPEQLEPDVNTHRWISSAIYNKPFGHENNWQTLFAWGRNFNVPGHSLDGFILESSVNLKKIHTVFTRIEQVEKDELFHEDEPKHGKAYWINKISLGYSYDLPVWQHMQWGIGGVGAVDFLPGPVDEAYGNTPVSFMLFLRVKIA